MSIQDEIRSLLERINDNEFLESDIDNLRQLLGVRDSQTNLQLGKFNVNIGKGKDIHIGDRIYGDINWKQVDFKQYFLYLRQFFSRHLSQGIGELFQGEANQYVPLRLQSTEKYTNANQNANQEDVITKIGTWEKLIPLSGIKLISGDSGSGKTALLLNIATALVKAIEVLETPIPTDEKQETYLPIYVPLSRFQGGDKNTLLAIAANACGQENRVLQSLWHQNHQPLCLLLDGIDEIPSLHFQSFLAAIIDLLQVPNAVNRHTLILTTRLGITQKQIKDIFSKLENNNKIQLKEFVILPFENEQIEFFLQHHAVPELFNVLKSDAHLWSIIKNPGLLAAIAVSVQEFQQLKLPQNAGQIYKLLIDYQLASQGPCQYDYWYIKRPILSNLAFMAFSQGLNNITINDKLYDQISQQIELIHHRYHRKKRIIPSDWNVQELLEELLDGAILSLVPIEDGISRLLSFKRTVYLEYFVAVYLESLEDSSSDIQLIVSNINIENIEKWFNPLIFLVGLKKESINIFDAIFGSHLQQATDFWLEKAPYGIKAPDCIVSEFKTKLTKLDSIKLTNYSEPLTERLLVRLLNSSSPVTRLRTVCALSQWGLSSVEMLLDAAEDSHPLVQAVAQYALLHLGEPLLSDQAEKPLPPLIIAERHQLQFHCYGGCNASIGPLHLIDAPQNIQIGLALNIEYLDIDLFKETSAFELWHTPPAWFAFSWFTSQKMIDWLGLAARCQWIAQHSSNIVQKMQSRPLLSGLSDELSRRAVHYAAFSQCFAKDMGLEIKSLDLSEQTYKSVASDYRRLRNLCNPINRSTLLKLDRTEHEHNDLNLEIKQNITKSNNSQFTGIIVENLTVLKDEQVNMTRLKNIELAQNIENSSSSTICGVEILTVKGDALPFPLIASVDEKLNIESSERSDIKGFLVHEIINNTAGFSINLSMNIERFKKSRFFGIIVKKYSVDTVNQGVVISTKTENL